MAEQALALNHRQVREFGKHGLGLLDRFAVAVLLEADAHLLEETRFLAAQVLDRLQRLFLETGFATVHVVEAASQFAGEFDVWNLVLTDRHLVGAVDQDVGAHQQRIAEEAIGRQILVGQLFLLILVGRHALKPAERRHHRQQQVKFGVLRHLGLDEQRRLLGVDAGCQPIDQHVHRRLLDTLRTVVLRGQGVPVGDEEQARIIVLELDPVLENTMVVAKMQRPGRAHAGENTFCVHIFIQ